jgi:hypothetical protein
MPAAAAAADGSQHGAGLAPARAGARSGPALGPVRAKTVSFGGYVISVPANWPVYWLNRDPSRCVRYDRHAVYLGRPGADQLCPAHLAGRVDTVSVQASGSRTLAAAGVWRQAPAAMGLRSGLRRAGGQVLQDAPDHQVVATASRPGLTISATYASTATLVSQIISSVRAVGRPGSQPPGSPPSASPPQGSPPQGSPPQGSPPQGSPPQGSPPQGSPAQGSPAQGSQPEGGGYRPGGSRLGGLTGRLGFDTCAAPSLRTMSAWRRAFSAIAIYIGGPEAACGWGNLSPAWVHAVTQMGWALIPTYVGRQAPCNRFRVRIQLGQAYVEGRAAASQAMGLAAALGLGRHAPLYDDMEAYHHQWGRCRREVLSFLNGWTRELHAGGHRSGVYSSAASAAVDLSRASTVYRWRLTKPDSIWFGLWDGRPNLDGAPYLPATLWPAGHRIKQWLGGHRRRLGGVTLNIDSDLVAGAVYRLAGLLLATGAVVGGVFAAWPGRRWHPAKLGRTRPRKGIAR